MRMHGSTSIFKQKRTWLIAGVVVIIAAAISMWVGASLQHKTVSERVDTAYSKAKVTSRTVFADKMSQAKRMAAVEQLSSIKITEKCDGEWWSAWYQMLPAAKKATLQCEAKVKHLKIVSRAAKDLKEYLDDDSKVAQSLALLTVSTASDEWQKTAQGGAETVQRTLEAISVTKHNQALLTAAKEKTKLIIDAWVALNQASSKEDKAAYLEAQGTLSQAYANVGAVSDVSDKQVVELVNVLQTSVNKL